MAFFHSNIGHWILEKIAGSEGEGRRNAGTNELCWLWLTNWPNMHFIDNDDELSNNYDVCNADGNDADLIKTPSKY